MDGRMRHLVDLVADSRQNFVEAFSLFPDGDLELAEARRAWPGKVISINFPSAFHLLTEEEIADRPRSLLAAARPGDRFVMGITEDIPEGAWQQSLPVISRVLREEGMLAD